MPANPRLEYCFGDLDPEQVVLARLEAPEILGENAERALDWRVDDDRGPDVGACRLGGHLSSSTGCSTAVLKAMSALFQKRSRSVRRVPSPRVSSW